jgi:hypothetical protein
MKRNTSFARAIISNYEGSPQMQKIELKRQKKNFSISQAINDYNNKKAKERTFFYSNNKNHNSSSNILNTSNFYTYNNLNSPNQNNNTTTSNKTSRTKPSIASIPVQKYKSKGPDTQVISTGEMIPLNLFEIFSNENDKALLFRYTKFNNETNIDTILFKLGTIRFNIFSQYISTCLNVISDYQTILNQPIIKSIQKYENGLMEEKQLLNMKKYILNFIKNLPEHKKNEQIKQYFKFLEKEIELGKKLGIDSDCYEINYLFNIFPKGIEITCDYDIFECVYYNSKKNNKISGKALLPSPEFCFKLDPDKIGIKFFDFEFEIEDLEDIKHIMSQIWKIIQDKIKVAQLFIEPCLAQVRNDLENKKTLQEKEKESKKANYKLPSFENMKNKNNINSINSKTNTTELTLTNNINENNTLNNNINIIGKKNYTYTTANLKNNNIIKNIETQLNLKKKSNNIIHVDKNKIKANKKGIIPLMKEDDENEDKKTNNGNEDVNEVNKALDDLDEEKSQSTEKKNNFFKDEILGSMNVSDDTK